jgi:hypothetical protein
MQMAHESSEDAAGFSQRVMGKVETATQIYQNGGRPETDYAVFAAQYLRIRTKSGAIAPLAFNRAQRFIHEKLEAQSADIGKVRALVLKGRQQGCSTYIAGRFYHRSSRNRGQRVFILTHEEQATQNLFEIVTRFHDHCGVKPSTGVDNSRELTFERLDSGYRVGTAGTRGIGRSSTVQLFHGSEVAFWPFAETHLAGILQAVADRPGTESILESTANGIGNVFHTMWREAEVGTNGYIAIFVPWYWQEEYRRPVAADFELDADEREYAALYGLNHQQMAWRRQKIVELRDPLLFKQEYPANAAEAFQMSGHDSFIPPALIARARKASCPASGPLIIGFDPAWTGGDRHAMAWREGRRVTKIECRTGLDTMQAAGWLKQVIEAEIAARAQASAIIVAEQGRWWTSMIRPLAALPVVIYIWKVIVYDKVLGLGTTDAITGDVGTWAGVIITTYFGGRTIEKVARIFRR